MLEGNFYKILEQSQEEPGKAGFSIEFDPLHPIFSGHFPGKPVVPGVCMMQIIQELLSKIMDRKLMIRKASNIKFLHIIDPTIHLQVKVTIDYSIDQTNVKTSANIANESLTFMKFAGEFS
jgi:3-hydroxyacyl-[acyl-carrier-protein] dehydratase